MIRQPEAIRPIDIYSIDVIIVLPLGRENNPAAIRGPDWIRILRGMLGQPAPRPTRHIEKIDVPISQTRRHKSNLFAIWRPRRLAPKLLLIREMPQAVTLSLIVQKVPSEIKTMV